MSSGQPSSRRRLAVRKQTLRALTDRQLTRVAGGTCYFDDGGGGGGYYDDTSMTQGPGGYSGPSNCGCC